MLGKQVKKQYTKAFIEYKRHSWQYALICLILYILQLTFLIIAGVLLLGTNVSNKLIFIIIVMFLIATRFRAFNNIIHECMHYSFCDNRKCNIIFGKICAAIVFTTYNDYKNEHLSHHKNLGDFEKDMDFHHRSEFKFEEKLTAKVVWRHIYTPIIGMHLPEYLCFNMSFKDGAIYGFLKIFLFMLIIGFGFINPVGALLFVVIPFIGLYTALNYWTDCVDHAGKINEVDSLYQSRNFIINKVLACIILPRNDCYHLVHHLFPNVPSQHLKDAHEKLLGNEEYYKVHQVKQIIKTATFSGVN